jgi:protein LTV1
MTFSSPESELIFFTATYTNLENHPRLIRARDPKPVPKIVLDRKTGLPSVLSKAETPKIKSHGVSFAGSDDTDGSDTEDGHGGLS